MTCTFCKGSGNLWHWTNDKPEIWRCPKCGGCGVSVQYGPATINPKHARATA